MRSSSLRRACLLARGAWLAPLVACGGGDDAGPRTIAEVRTATVAARPAQVGASPRERFEGPEDDGAMMPERPIDPETLPFRWDVPDGWKQLEPTSHRLVNMIVGDDPSTQCYVSLLPGDGGGLLENVDRWRSQMGLGPLADQAAARELPKITMLGAAATLVDIEGTFTGMSGQRIESARLVGAILAQPEFTLYVKLTGPGATVARERASFDAFCASLRLRSAGAHGEEAAHHEGDGHDHGAHDAGAIAGGAHGTNGADAPGTGARAARAGGFAWRVPEGWADAQGSSMRLVSYRPGGSPRTECYVTQLGGDGGGLGAQINRWLGQFSAPALDAAGLAALERVPTLGREGVLVEAHGPYVDMSGKDQGPQSLLGVVLLREQDGVYFKMIGPREEVLAERERFLELVRSFEEAP